MNMFGEQVGNSCVGINSVVRKFLEKTVSSKEIPLGLKRQIYDVLENVGIYADTKSDIICNEARWEIKAVLKSENNKSKIITLNTLLTESKRALFSDLETLIQNDYWWEKDAMMTDVKKFLCEWIGCKSIMDLLQLWSENFKKFIGSRLFEMVTWKRIYIFSASDLIEFGEELWWNFTSELASIIDNNPANKSIAYLIHQYRRGNKVLHIRNMRLKAISRLVGENLKKKIIDQFKAELASLPVPVTNAHEFFSLENPVTKLHCDGASFHIKASLLIGRSLEPDEDMFVLKQRIASVVWPRGNTDKVKELETEVIQLKRQIGELTVEIEKLKSQYKSVAALEKVVSEEKIIEAVQKSTSVLKTYDLNSFYTSVLNYVQKAVKIPAFAEELAKDIIIGVREKLQTDDYDKSVDVSHWLSNTISMWIKRFMKSKKNVPSMINSDDVSDDQILINWDLSYEDALVIFDNHVRPALDALNPNQRKVAEMHFYQKTPFELIPKWRVQCDTRASSAWSTAKKRLQKVLFSSDLVVSEDVAPGDVVPKESLHANTQDIVPTDKKIIKKKPIKPEIVSSEKPGSGRKIADLDSLIETFEKKWDQLEYRPRNIFKKLVIDGIDASIIAEESKISGSEVYAAFKKACDFLRTNSVKSSEVNTWGDKKEQATPIIEQSWNDDSFKRRVADFEDFNKVIGQDGYLKVVWLDDRRFRKDELMNFYRGQLNQLWDNILQKLWAKINAKSIVCGDRLSPESMWYSEFLGELYRIVWRVVKARNAKS